jgi:hypothetical protein
MATFNSYVKLPEGNFPQSKTTLSRCSSHAVRVAPQEDHPDREQSMDFTEGKLLVTGN